MNVKIFLMCIVLAASSSSATDLQINAKRMEERIAALSQFGKNPEGGVSRVAFSDADIAGRNYIQTLLKEAGLQVRIDTAGNIIGKREGKNSSLAPIVFGSHIDSVPGGGNYDGDVGVIAAIECIEVLKAADQTTQHPLEVIVFSDEEGGLVGSKSMAGEFHESAMEIKSHSGKTIREGVRAIGGDPDRINEAQRSKDNITAFLELHIEQGGILESEKINIGVVEGIVGINWWDVTVQGFANHAGTTPMNQRKDALLAAAKLITAVNEVVTSIAGRQVATVGRIKAEPGAPNVIPGKVVMSLEIRDLSAEKIQMVYEKIQEKAKQIEQQSGTTITFNALDTTAVPALSDERIRKIISEAAKELGFTYKLMPSGAGHDAQDIARIAPMGMIFVPSVGGISHSPKEFTRTEDMANGAAVLLHTILKIDSGSLK